MGRSASARRRLRPLVGFLTVLVVLLVVWETTKFIGGDRWHIEDALGTGVTIDHDPPLIITEDQLAEGFEVIDQALEIADQAVA